MSKVTHAPEKTERPESERPESVTLTIEYRPVWQPDHDFVEWEDLTLTREIAEWTVFRFSPWVVHPSPFQSENFERERLFRMPAEAWDWISPCFNDDTSSIMVGPGVSPAVLTAPKFDAHCWTVYSVDENCQCVEVGKFLHRLCAMRVMKMILGEGGCPVVTSPYLSPDAEWDSIRVLDSSELATGCMAISSEWDGDVSAGQVGDEAKQLTRSLGHLLSLARKGKHSGASGCERQARRIVDLLLDDVIGLDGSATAGIGELIALIQSQPMDGRDAAREAIQ